MDVGIKVKAEKKPKVKLTGQSGNAYMVLGLCNRAMKAAKWSDARREAVLTEMKSGDYDHLLLTAMIHFEVV